MKRSLARVKVSIECGKRFQRRAPGIYLEDFEIRDTMCAMFKTGILILGSIPAILMCAADLKVTTTRQASGGFMLSNPGPSSQITIYVHDTTQRVEFTRYPFGRPGLQPHHHALITHCDTGVVDELDLDGKEYREFKLDKFPNEDQFAKELARMEKEDRKHEEFNVQDTGETKEFQGHPVKHWVTTIKGKDKETKSEETVDGWYMELPEPGCAPEYLRLHHGVLQRSVPAISLGIDSRLHDPNLQDPHDPSFHGISAIAQEGDLSLVFNWYLPTGLTMYQKSTQKATIKVDGRTRDNTVVSEQRVVEFSEAPIDPALFTVPADFKKVRDLYQHKNDWSETPRSVHIQQ